MAEGKIVQCIGAVVDVRFSPGDVPQVYDALKMEGSDLTLEVQQQLGGGIVPVSYTHLEDCSDAMFSAIP